MHCVMVTIAFILTIVAIAKELVASACPRAPHTSCRLLTPPAASATEFLMESPHRGRFIVSVEQNYALANFVAVITCSDDVPRMHLLAELPPLGHVATGAIAGLFMRKLELCCLQVRPSPCFIALHPLRCFVPLPCAI